MLFWQNAKPFCSVVFSQIKSSYSHLLEMDILWLARQRFGSFGSLWFFENHDIYDCCCFSHYNPRSTLFPITRRVLHVKGEACFEKNVKKTFVSIGKISVIRQNIDIQDSPFSSNVLIVSVDAVDESKRTMDESLRIVQQQQQKTLLSRKNTNMVNSIYKKPRSKSLCVFKQVSEIGSYLKFIDILWYKDCGISAKIPLFERNG